MEVLTLYYSQRSTEVYIGPTKGIHSLEMVNNIYNK